MCWPTLPYLEAPLSGTLLVSSCQLGSVRSGRNAQRGPGLAARRACPYPNDYGRRIAVNRRHRAGATFVLVAYLSPERERERENQNYCSVAVRI